MSDFLHMGGYGPYVWMAVGVTAAVLAGNLIAVRRRAKVIRSRLQARMGRQRSSPDSDERTTS